MRSQTPCPVCGVYMYVERYWLSDRLYQTTDDEFSVIECRGCGLLRLDPQPEAPQLKRYYPDRYWAYGKVRRGLAGIYRRMVLRDHIRFVRKAIKSLRVARVRVLDLGCGSGDLLAALRADKQAGIGMDISRPALRAAAEVGVPGVVADYRCLPFAGASFDVVMMFHMLEHIPDPDAALRAAAYLLRPEGKLLVQVPNTDSLQFAILGKRWSGLDVPRHLYDYRRQDLELFLERNGFVVTRRKYFSLRDNAQALATSLAPWMDPMARRVRRPKRLGPLRLAGDLAYFSLVLSCLPFAVFEALFRRGATLTVEAEKVTPELAKAA